MNFVIYIIEFFFESVTRNMPMDVIQDLAGIEREREKEANKLRRRSRQTILRINFSQLGEGYAAIKEI